MGKSRWIEHSLVSATVAIEVCYALRPDGSRAAGGHRYRVRDNASSPRGFGAPKKTLRDARASAIALVTARGEVAR